MHSREFTFAFVAILSLGVGVNGAILSALDTYAWHPLPYPQADHLRIVYTKWLTYGWRFPGPAIDLDQVAGVESSGRFMPTQANIEFDGRFHSVPASMADYGLFRTLEIQPILGRWLTPSNANLPPKRETLLSYGLWKAISSGNPNVLGKTLKVNGERYLIVGVMPKSFGFPTRDTAIWMPFKKNPVEQAGFRGPVNAWPVIRLRPGVRPRTVDLALNSYFKSVISRSTPPVKAEASAEGWQAGTSSLSSWFGGFTARNLMEMQLGAVLLLILSLASLLNLATNRHLGRQREIAIRRAVGASSFDIIRLVLPDAVIVGIVASILATVVAYFGQRLFGLFSIGSAQTPFLVSMSFREYLLIPLCTFSLCVLCFLAPLASSNLHWFSTPLAQPGDDDHVASRSVERIRRVLSTAQIALTILILVLAGLLGTSLINKVVSNNSVRTQGLLVTSVTLPGSQYAGPGQREQAWQELHAHLERLPGIKAVATGDGIPFADAGATAPFTRTDSTGPETPHVIARVMHASPNLGKLLGLHLLSGRFITTQDIASQAPVIVVDSFFSKALFNSINVIGKSAYLDNKRWTIVGVIKGISDQYTAYKSRGTVIFPNQPGARSLSFLVHSSSFSDTIKDEITNAVYDSLQGHAVVTITAMRNSIISSASDTFGLFVLFAAFGAAAFLASAIGIYVLISQSCKRKRREHAIRRALGAGDSRLVFAILRSGLILWGIGSLIGIICAVFAQSALQDELYGTSRLAPYIYVAVLAFVGIVVLIASWIPARNANKVPISVLLGS